MSDYVPNAPAGGLKYVLAIVRREAVASARVAYRSADAAYSALSALAELPVDQARKLWHEHDAAAPTNPIDA